MAAERDESQTRLIAFYLPQFHAIAENDEWWGEGFTEWVNVKKAKPLFDGHRQPRRPAELGYYDLGDPSILEKQAAMAKANGIDAFCYYYYDFGGGKRLLEMPLDRMLATGKPDFPFCLCWANENWTRTWDGGDHSILMRQEYGDENIDSFARGVIPFFQDPRYLRLGDKPLLVIYHTRSIPETRDTLQRMRRIWREEAGLSVHVAAALTFGESDPIELGVDSAVEFPPHNITDAYLPPEIVGLGPEHPGLILDYLNHAHQKLATRPPFPCFSTVFTGWDNTPRRGERGTVFLQDGPLVYHEWLRETIRQSDLRHESGNSLVFINAWNEWAEGAYLEPDEAWGYAYLEATRLAKSGEDWLDGITAKLDRPAEITPMEQRVLQEGLRSGSVLLGHLAQNRNSSFRFQSRARHLQARLDRLRDKHEALRAKRDRDREKLERERTQRLRLESSGIYRLFRHLHRWENSLKKRFTRLPPKAETQPDNAPTERVPPVAELTSTTPVWESDHDLRLGDLRLRLTDAADLKTRESTEHEFVLGKDRPLVVNTLSLIDSLRPTNIIDLGIYKGGSLVLLNETCRPGKLVGIDRNPILDPALAHYLDKPENVGRVKAYPGIDQADLGRLDKIYHDEFPGELLDLVIDDASHYWKETRESFRSLFPRLREGGLYVIEDWGWAHWPGEFWQRPKEGSYFHGKEPLSKLAWELTVLSASAPELIAKLTIDRVQIVIERGPMVLDSPFEPEALLLNRGHSLPFLEKDTTDLGEP